MEKHKVKAFSPALLLFALAVASMLAEAAEPTPVERTMHIAACLMTLMRDIASPVALGMMMLGAIIYIGAGESEKTRLMGKHYFIMGITGIVCIYIVVALAAMAPFSITPGQCKPLY